MDLAEYRDGLEAGIVSLNENSADCQLLLIELEAKRARFLTVESLKAGRQAVFDNRLPMWRYEPTSEQTTDRGADGVYIYFYWRNGHGPRPKEGGRMQRKTYIGARPDRIQLARDMVENLRKSRRLDRAISGIKGALRASERNLSSASGVLVRALDQYDNGDGAK